MEFQEYEKRHIEALRKVAPECTVLLKKNGAFPIKKPCSVALFGSGARRTLKGGTGSGDVYSRYYTTVEQGLINAGFKITSGEWLDSYDKFADERHRVFARRLRKKIKDAGVPGMLLYSTGAIDTETEYEFSIDYPGDICVYVLARLSGEGTDRQPVKGDLYLTDGEVRDILTLNKKYKKFMLVLNVSGVVDLTPVKEVSNILVLSQLGVPTGDVLADILLGKSYPSGRLTTTWTTFSDYQTIGEFGNLDDTRYNEGIYVGYRYFETLGIKTLFPFGFGLSFTEFETEFSGIKKKENGLFEVTAEVKNVGKCAGKNVAEVYVSCPWGRFDKAKKELAGYIKTKELAPGESEKVKVSVSLPALSTYDEKKAEYILEKGNYIVSIGDNSADTRPCAVIVLDNDAVVRKVRNIGGKVDFEDYVPEKPADESIAGLKKIKLSASEIETEVISYRRGGKYDKVEKFVKNLTDDQLISLCIGNYNRTVDGGDPGNSVYGAVGETTKLIPEVFRNTLVLSDGPAGLRLTKEIIKTPKGELCDIFEHELDWLVDVQPYKERMNMKRWLAKRPKGEHIYQYCTAIPIATAVAQSWSIGVAETLGDIVGEELEHFGVNIWLAPALNIHRSVLCGRNFEYYSEDPLISGAVAAAITRGVMKHKGTTTTIKHYCCNNQEFNRFGNNSLVSERAMREIYMRGFEYALKNSDARAVMTTYNLLNGVHTCARKDLCYDVLRAEWGFDGVVMTDWAWTGGNEVGNKYGGFVCSEIFAADNDLMMPGRESDFADAKKALEEGRLTRKQLEINGSRIYRLIMSLGGTEKEIGVASGADYMNDREASK